MDVCFIYMTASNFSEAKMLARHIVEEKLAACANILPNASSIYWWDGKVEQNDEVVIIAKTTQAKVSALTTRVNELHSYDCPCVVTLPISGGNDGFLAWIEETLAT